MKNLHTPTRRFHRPSKTLQSHYITETYESNHKKLAHQNHFGNRKKISPTIAQLKKSSTFAVAFELRER